MASGKEISNEEVLRGTVFVFCLCILLIFFRIYHRDLQEKMFEALGFTKEEAYEHFGFLQDAFQYGVPPHGGLAYGLDRIVMLMAKADSIRNVIAFPKVKDASDPMSDAPNIVEEKQLK